MDIAGNSESSMGVTCTQYKLFCLWNKYSASWCLNILKLSEETVRIALPSKDYLLCVNNNTEENWLILVFD